MKQLLYCAAVILAFASCNSNYEKTPSGVEYKIFPGKEGGPKLKAGQFIKMNIEYSVRLSSGKDSVLTSTFGKLPGYSPVDTSARAHFSFMEVLPKCSSGDSLQVRLSIDSLKKLGAIQDYNKVFVKGGYIECKAKILKVFPNQADLMVDYQAESKKITADEIKDLQAYAAKKGIQVQETKNGVLVNIVNAGDQTMKADSGMQVTLMYKGSLESTGDVFDTNMDSSKHHTQPFVVALGRHASIPGMEEGLKLFGKGGQGTLYIPAMLGYGPQGSPPVIPAYSNLIFDIIVTDVKIAPPPAPRPPMGQMTPQQRMQMMQQMQKMRHGKDTSKAAGD